MIFTFCFLTFSVILFHRLSIITVLDLLPHISKFNYLNSEVIGHQCLVRIRVELKKKKTQKEKQFLSN